MGKLTKPIRDYVASEYLWCKQGSPCWVEQDAGDHLEDDDVFLAAQLIEIDTEKLTATVKYVEKSDGPDTIHLTRIMQRDPKQYSRLTDLVDLPILNDAELHEKIRERFKNNKIMTYIGPSLLIVNPFRRIKASQRLMDTFYDCVMNPNTARVRDHPPHVWAIATHSYLELYLNNKNQAICISGESGAGKTFNTKTAMAFLTGLNEKFGGVQVAAGESKIEDRIMMCNPVLEALGNAKTVRNDNSSRFGKYISLFVENNCIIGASIKSYLLEAIRITTPNESERNYHIFYQLLRGGDKPMIREFGLDREPFHYKFLKKSGCKDVHTINDIDDYHELLNSLQTLGVNEEKKKSFFKVIAASLLTSKIEYDDSNYDGTAPCEISDLAAVSSIAKILSVDEAALKKALTVRTTMLMGKEIVSYLDKLGCYNQAEAFAKEIYSKLFDWIIKYLNLALLPARERKTGQDPETLYKKIGLLDIFGFEIFNFNSIEQLCINYTNEKLHQLYIEYVFKLEEKTFINEGLSEFLCNLNFEDNEPIIKLLGSFSKRDFSVFNLIDDQAASMCKDMNLISQFQSIHRDHPNMAFQKTRPNAFVIIHTAKNVSYTIDGFCEKNKDEVAKPIIECMLNSGDPSLVDIYKQKIFDNDPGVDYFAEKKQKNENFIGYKFRMQMEELMTELRSCQCSFMRCIKPNEVKSASVWTSTIVVNQIRYLGLLDSIKIRRESYPFRFQYKRFVFRYLELEPTYSQFTPDQLDAANPDYVNLAKNICEASIPKQGTDTLLFGNTRVFMKSEAYENLEKIYEKAVQKKKEAIKFLDKILLQIVLRNRIIDFRRKGEVTVDIARQMIQGISGRASGQGFKSMRKSIIKMQRGYRAKKLFRIMRKQRMALTTVQSGIQALVQQKKRQKYIEAGKLIGLEWRKYSRWAKFKFYVDVMFIVVDCAELAVIESLFREKVYAALYFQRYWRGFKTRKENQRMIEKARKAREEFRLNKALNTVRRYIKGRLARMRLKKIHNAAMVIQANYRMIWTQAYYKRMKKAAVKIEKAFRESLKKKVLRKKRRAKYLRRVYIPFLKNCYKDQSYLYQVDVGPEDELEPGLRLGRVKLKEKYCQIPSINPRHLERARFFCEVIDVDYLRDMRKVYTNGWSREYIDANKDCLRLNTDVRVIEVGSFHTNLTTSQGRCYCWGDNTELQLGTDQLEENMAVFRLLKGEERLRRVAVGDEHNVVLTKHKTVFTFGSNNRGQLGLNDTKGHLRIIMNETLSRCKLTGVFAKKDESFGITGDGKVVFWPISDKNLSIGVLNLPDKQKARTMSLGDDFVMILTHKGYLYSYGQKNEKGQLGLGHDYPVSKPTWISTLKTERIKTISCGRSHTLALTKNNKIYSWGEGSDGQLGHGVTDDFLKPTAVKMRQGAERVIQVASSFRGSYALLNNGKVFWWGRNSRIAKLSRPQLLRGASNNEHFTVQVRTSWSNTMSIAYLILCDLRYLDGVLASNKIITAREMANRWAEGISQYELPFCETYSKYISTKNLDFKSGKSVRRNPDPIKKLEVYEERPFLPPRDIRTIEPFNYTPGIDQHHGHPIKEPGAWPISVNPHTSDKWRTILMSPRREIKTPHAVKFKSSVRRSQYYPKKINMKEILGSAHKVTLDSRDTSSYYSFEQLKEMKLRLKDLMTTPRSRWTKDDFNFIKSTQKGDLRKKLSKIKL